MTADAGTGHVATWRIVNVSPVVLEVALVLAGLDMIITGITGHCPLYQKLGRAPRPPRSTP